MDPVVLVGVAAVPGVGRAVVWAVVSDDPLNTWTPVDDDGAVDWQNTPLR